MSEEERLRFAADTIAALRSRVKELEDAIGRWRLAITGRHRSCSCHLCEALAAALKGTTDD